MNIERVRERLKKHEAVIPWMYQDTTEHVTVGCGRCLETVEEAKSLTFVDRGVSKNSNRFRSCGLPGLLRRASLL